jgi:YEATS domain-containing protein 4
MPHTTTPLPSKTGIQLEDVESAAKPQRIKPTDYTDNNINQVIITHP